MQASWLMRSGWPHPIHICTPQMQAIWLTCSLGLFCFCLLSHCQSTRFTDTDHTVWLHLGSRDPNSGPHTCTAYALCAEPFPRPSLVLLSFHGSLTQEENPSLTRSHRLTYPNYCKAEPNKGYKTRSQHNREDKHQGKVLK